MTNEKDKKYWMDWLNNNGLEISGGPITMINNTFNGILLNEYITDETGEIVSLVIDNQVII